MISEDTVERVLSSTDIVDLIQSYFPLRKVGLDYSALCPFHSEKSPSFTVSPSKQMYYCFGCGAGGGAARFLMERESVDFPAAIRRLGERAGIPIVEDAVSPEVAGKLKLRTKLLAIHHEVTQWYHWNLLRKPFADKARQYLKNRGLGIEVARDWQLGYAPAEPRLFFDWARSKGYDNELLTESGLVAEREGPTGQMRIVGRFRDRLMFPVCNDFGEVIAFSGRTLDPEANVAKYLNSPETALFSKSKTLFGLHRSKRPILKAGRAVICEGQIDLITAFSHGIETLVAPLGTAFTNEHARMLKRLTQEVIVCFDADAAGFKAAQRTFKSLAESDIFVRAVEMPDGEDPDSYIQKFGGPAFQKLIDQASDFLDFHIAHRSRSADLNSPKEQHELARELADNIALIRDKLMQDTIINGVASRLGISHEEFRRTVFAAKKRHQRQQKSESRWSDDGKEAVPNVIEFQDPSSKLLCQMVLIEIKAKTWLAEQISNYKDPQYIPDGDLLAKLANGSYDPTEPSSVGTFLSTLDASVENGLAQLTMKPPAGDHFQAAKDSWRKLTLGVVRRRYHEVEGRLKKRVTDPNAIIELLVELKRLKEMLDRPEDGPDVTSLS
jgi:DNA primase